MTENQNPKLILRFRSADGLTKDETVTTVPNAMSLKRTLRYKYGGPSDKERVYHFDGRVVKDDHIIMFFVEEFEPNDQTPNKY